METAVEVVQRAYAAFGKGDMPTVLALIDDEIEWKFCGPKGLPYTRSCRSKREVAEWFASIPSADEILAFEPREFIQAGETVTVLGWERTKAIPSGKTFEAEWAHVFTVANGRINRFWGIMDTEANAAARR